MKVITQFCGDTMAEARAYCAGVEALTGMLYGESGRTVIARDPEGVTRDGRTFYSVLVTEEPEPPELANDTPDPDEMDEPETPQCPMCKGPGMFLGQLGQLTHFRCRNCGVVFHTPRA